MSVSRGFCSKSGIFAPLSVKFLLLHTHTHTHTHLYFTINGSKIRKKAETQIRETQVIQSQTDNEPHTRPNRDKSLTKYSLHAKQTILSDRAYLCKNFNFLLPFSSRSRSVRTARSCHKPMLIVKKLIGVYSSSWNSSGIIHCYMLSDTSEHT